ncbi:MAG TPA: hypothetical protein DCS82_07025 [Rhodospirillaceae bacterium]|nr:hypothetical protein [Rhodospirillaceae bacterium]HAA93688.1 hypothetical protein [Rhodospirillaceae bacterium]HAT35450.1 hypothetical protein [Rhodospirillaceae bacterium]|tara:strand:- start:385 stop:984 length:600 start_codon:yes stop_codon:yes gene_type:complete
MLTAKHVSDLALNGKLADVCDFFDRFGSSDANIIENPVAENITHEGVHALWSMYQEAKAENERPLWGAFDILDFPKLAGNLHVLAFDEGQAMKFLIFGSSVADRYGTDKTGDYLPLEGENLVVVFHGLFLAAAESGKIYHTTHIPPEEGPIKDCQRLILPFYDDRGKFSRLLVSHLPFSATIGSIARPARRSTSRPRWR